MQKRQADWTRGVFRGGPLGHGPPFGSPGLQNCIKKWAKLRHAPPHCKLGIRYDYTKAMLRAFLPGVWLWNRTKSEWRPFFFCSSPNFGQKKGWNLNEGPFFCSSPNFGRKNWLNLSGTISNSDHNSSQFFWSFCPPLFKILRTLLD